MSLYQSKRHGSYYPVLSHDRDLGSDIALLSISNHPNRVSEQSKSQNASSSSSSNTALVPVKGLFSSPLPHLSWRLKDRVKTVCGGLVVCLNIGVDPPDVFRPHPSAKIECWIDPYASNPSKSLEAIGKNLTTQYEFWQPKARFRPALDPTSEDVKKICSLLRKSSKDDRVLFHYNGHGVPRPTSNGELWVFNKAFTQYIPMSIFEIQSMLGPAPVIYVLDCSGAGHVVNTMSRWLEQKRLELWMHWQAAQAQSNAYHASEEAQQRGRVGSNSGYSLDPARHLSTTGLFSPLASHSNLPLSSSLSPLSGPFASSSTLLPAHASATAAAAAAAAAAATTVTSTSATLSAAHLFTPDPNVISPPQLGTPSPQSLAVSPIPPPVLPDILMLAATASDQILSFHPDMPADLFTACLTTPIEMAIRWYLTHQNPPLHQLTLDMALKIPGRLNDRKSPLGELNWILTAITDTIAWNILPKETFQKLYRQDILVAGLFRNFLLAERIMRSLGGVLSLNGVAGFSNLNMIPDRSTMSSSSMHGTGTPAPTSLYYSGGIGASVGVGASAAGGGGGGGSYVSPVPSTHSTTSLNVPHPQHGSLASSAFGHSGSNSVLTPVSWPPIPAAWDHPFWDAWDLVLETTLGQIPAMLTQGAEYVPSNFFVDQLLSFEVWLKEAQQEITVHPSKISTLPFSYAMHSMPLFLNRPEQLPNILQVLLSPAHRLRALDLLAHFFDLGAWAIHESLSVGVFAYLLKLLQSPASELKPVLVYLWSRLLAFDTGTQCDLVKEESYLYFLHIYVDEPSEEPLAHFEEGSSLSNQAFGKFLKDNERALSALILNLFMLDYPIAHSLLFRAGLLDSVLDYLSRTLHAEKDAAAGHHLLIWSLFLLSQFFKTIHTDRLEILFQPSQASPFIETLSIALAHACPEVRATATYVLGVLLSVLPHSSSRSSNTATVALASPTPVPVSMPVSSHTSNSPLPVPVPVPPPPPPPSPPHSAISSPSQSLHSAPTNRRSQIESIVIDLLCKQIKDAAVLVRIEIVHAFSIYVNAYAKRMSRFLATMPEKGLKSSSSSLKKFPAPLPSFQSYSSYEGGSNSLDDMEGTELIEDSDLDLKSCLFVWKALLELHADPHPQVSGLALSISESLKTSSGLFGSGPSTDKKNATRTTTNRRSMTSRLLYWMMEFYFSSCSTMSRSVALDEHSLILSRRKKIIDRYIDECCDWESTHSDVKKFEQQMTILDMSSSQSSCTKSQFHPIEPWLVVSDDHDYVSVWNWEKPLKLSQFRNKGRIAFFHIIGTEGSTCVADTGLDRSLLLVGSDDGIVRVWKNYSHSINSIEDGPTLATSWQAFPDLHPPPSGARPPVIVSSYWQTSCQRLLASGGESRSVRIWDARSEQCVRVVPTKSLSSVTCLSGNSGEPHVFVGGFTDGTIRLYDLRAPASESLVQSFREHHGPIMNIHWQPGHPHHLLSGSQTGQVKLWDLNVRESNMPSSLMTLEVFPNGGMSCMTVHEQISLLACGTSHQSIKLYMLNSLNSIAAESVPSRALSNSRSTFLPPPPLPHDTTPTHSNPIPRYSGATPGSSSPIHSISSNASSHSMPSSGSASIHSLSSSTMSYPVSGFYPPPVHSNIRYHEGFLGQRLGPVLSLSFHPNKLLLAASSADANVSLFGPKRES